MFIPLLQNWRSRGKGRLKTLWTKEKMLVASIFSFSHNVFYHMKDKFNIFSETNMSSANAFNLDKVKSWASKRELTRETDKLLECEHCMSVVA